MPPNTFTGTQTGALLLQAAQSLIAVNNQRKQLELQREKTEATMELERRGLEIREQNAAIQQQFADAQIKFAELRAETAPLQRAQTEAEIALTRQRTLSLQEETGKVKGPSGAQFSSARRSMISSISKQLVHQRAGELGVNVQAGDTVESMKAEVLRLSNVNATLLEDIGEKGALGPITQRTVQRNQQRREALRQVLEDPTMVNALNSLETGEGVSPEAWRRGLLDILGGTTSMTPADQDALVGELLQRGAEDEAAQAARGLFGGLDDSRVKTAVDSAVAGDITTLSAMVRRFVVPQATGSAERNRAIGTELLRLGYDQDAIRSVIRQLATQLSSQ